MTDSLGLDTRPMLRGMLAELDTMAAIGASDEELEGVPSCTPSGCIPESELEAAE